MAGVTLAMLIATSAVAVPAYADSFTYVKGTSGHGRTLTLWKNNKNGLVHANLRGALYGDKLTIGSCCPPLVNYQEVVSTGQSELNTREYNNWDPTINGILINGKTIHR